MTGQEILQPVLTTTDPAIGLLTAADALHEATDKGRTRYFVGADQRLAEAARLESVDPLAAAGEIAAAEQLLAGGGFAIQCRSAEPAVRRNPGLSG